MLYFLFFLFVLAFTSFNLATLPFSNPYTLTMIFGKKGSGKSTTMSKIAFQHLKKGWKVYSNVPLPGCFRIREEDIGFRMIPPKSLLLIDEVGMIWDNRNFKSFKPEVRDWFKLQRHYKVKVVLFSQTFDVDKKIRDLTDDMYLIEKRFRVFAYGRRILKKSVLTEASADQPSRIDENLKFDSILFAPFGSRLLTFIPRWSDSFDSFAAPQLPRCPWPLDKREFNPLTYRYCACILGANLAYVLGLDKLKRRIWKAKERVEDELDAAPEEIDFEKFFSTPAGHDEG